MQQFEVGLESLIDPELVKLSIEDAGRDVEQHALHTISFDYLFFRLFITRKFYGPLERPIFSAWEGIKHKFADFFSNSKRDNFVFHITLNV